MQTVHSPYLQVQAIRRMYKDQGKPTLAKPGWYSLTVNFAGTGGGEVAQAVQDIDGDSDFVWLSTYHYFQNGVYSPDVGSSVVSSESGQCFGNVGAGTQQDIIEVRFLSLQNDRALHNLDFISDGFCDFVNFSAAQTPWGSDFEVGQVQDGGHPFEGEGSAIAGGFVALSVWRGWMPEPRILPATSEIQISVRRIFPIAALPLRGHVFLMWGVRLYVGRS